MGTALSLISGVLYAVLVAAAARPAIRERDPLARDVSLVFAPLAALFLLTIVEALVGRAPGPIGAVAVLLLFAQPLFALRLVADLRAVPRRLLPAAAGLLAAAAIVLFGAGSAQRPAGALVAVAVFVALEGLAALYLAAEARRRRGGARARLAIAAFATAAFGGAIVAAGAAAIAGLAAAATAAAQLVSLVAALGYVAAFLPPSGVRRIWGATAAVDFLERLAAAPAAEPEEALWGRLTRAAEAVGATVAAVLVETADGWRIAAASGAGLEPGLLAAAAAQRAGLRDELMARTGARFATSVPIGLGADRSAELVLLTRHALLFGADDVGLLRVLGAHVAALVERRAVLSEQERLAARLAETVEALRDASRAKSDFLASMSHELRTPLNAIIGFTELMREGPALDGRLAVPAEWVEHVYSSGGHLLELINDVLDLSKVEAGRLELVLEWVDLGAAVTESVAGLRPLAERKRLRIETAVPATTVRLDRGRLRQILYNLLSNAIKFTPDGGSIRIAASEAQGELRLAVSDTGIGIAPADQAHVFEEFRQVGDPALRQSGTGLGLALTRRLVEAHGGRIELRSTPREGSTFTVLLPIVAQPVPAARDLPATARPALRPAPAATARDVLIIEDDPGAVRLLRTYLEADGYAVRVAADGERGLAEARRDPPAAILLDVLLPGIDGWDVLRGLKADEALRNIPVIIVTVVDEREVGLALGAVDYFLKPVDRDALLARLARYTFTTKVKHGPVRVLAVDDDPAALALVETALAPSGFSVTSTTSGRAAVELARAEPFELVICDLVMPELDGFGVVAALKADGRTRDAVILILTAHELSEADKARLNGHVAGIVDKGTMAAEGLRAWLARALPTGPLTESA